jgi:hypothetical protein
MAVNPNNYTNVAQEVSNKIAGYLEIFFSSTSYYLHVSFVCDGTNTDQKEKSAKKLVKNSSKKGKM